MLVMSGLVVMSGKRCRFTWFWTGALDMVDDEALDCF